MSARRATSPSRASPAVPRRAGASAPASAPLIVVLGASGAQGGAAARALLATHGAYRVLVLGRSVERLAPLAALGAATGVCDLEAADAAKT
jgi:NADP-dependent 3-hydroxy acid dehydrogenase YdfG